jgi:hypothetical protein
MCVYDLAILDVGTFRVRDLVPYELVKTGDRNTGAPFVIVVVVVADMEEEVPVVEDANTRELAVGRGHFICPLES